MFNETLTLVQTCGTRISHNLDFNYLCRTVTATHTRSSITSSISYQTPRCTHDYYHLQPQWITKNCT